MECNVRRLTQFVVAAFLLGVAGGASAQTGTTADDLPDLTLDELLAVKVHSAARHEQRPFDSPRSISVITADEIRRRNYRTTPEALNDIVGVVVQETTYAAGSPIMRGLIGNQILILVDGIRLNNAIYRLGPNQYLNTVDVNQIERIEVIRGPGSVLFGSDALGGLINIVTKSRATDGRGLEGEGSLRVSSADLSSIERAALSYATSKVGVVGGVSLRRFGDLRAGGGVGRQPFTGYSEWDGDVKLRAALRDGRLEAGIQHVSQQDVFRADFLLSGRSLNYKWDPQRRDLAYVKYETKAGVPGVDEMSFVASYQKQSERYEIVTAALPTVQEKHRDGVGTAGFTVQLSSSLPRRHLLTYGLEYYHDRVSSTRDDLDLPSGIRRAKTPAFADGSTYRTTALFVQDEIEVTRRLAVALGLRYSALALRAEVQNPLVGVVAIDSRPSALTGSGYGVYRLTPRLHLVFGAGQGFRAPNVNDTTVVGEFAGGFEIPNPDVEPERTAEYKVGLKGQYQRLHATASYYVTDYDDGIDVGPTTQGGLTFLDLNGNGLKDATEPDLYRRINTSNALIQGVELEGLFRLSAGLMVSGNVTWTHGRDSETGGPLRRIPPVGGRASIEWAPTSKLRLEYQNTFSLAQTRLAPLDIKDPRIGPGGARAYNVSTVRLNFDVQKRGAIAMALGNIADRAYKLFSSGFQAPGFGIVLGYQQKF